MKKILGKTTTYTGIEHGYMNGYEVRIIAILKNGNNPNIDMDGPEYFAVKDDAELERVGGVTTLDRVEVQPWIEKEGRFSWVSSNPRAEDLACFKHLASGK